MRRTHTHGAASYAVLCTEPALGLADRQHYRLSRGSGRGGPLRYRRSGLFLWIGFAQYVH